MKKHLVLILTLVCSMLASPTLSAQKPKVWSSTDLYEAIQKLNFLGSAMYVAAHPDDENQRMISYLANHKKARTAYLAITRGDGGQNEIGPEIQELLGIIRTQELLAARRIDGGNQMFTRANDFGYSKSPEETLRIWDREEILGDVIWAIRKWRPDVIINRFSHDSGRRTHGHHTSSAILSHEAFDLAGDESVYPEQLKYVEPWQPKRLFFNTSWWFYGSREKFAEADKSRMMSVDVGVYYPERGLSNTEIAMAARSMHKAQGFGTVGSRGSTVEYLELIKGDMPPQKEDLFEGINTSWSRVDGGEAVGMLLEEVEKEFQFTDPSASIPKLLKAYKMMKALPDGFWKKAKLAEIEQVIAGCMGLYTEAFTDVMSAVPGQPIDLTLEATNRSSADLVLQSINFLPETRDTTLNLKLGDNEENKLFKTITIPAGIRLTNPYWLNKKGEMGRYTVEDQKLRGLPLTPNELQMKFSFLVDGEPLEIVNDVVYKRRDPVEGEVYRPLEITPPVFANVADKVYVFGTDEPKIVEVILKAGKENVKGRVELRHPEGWKAEPASIDFELPQKGSEKTVQFQLFPPTGQDENFIIPIVHVDGKPYSKEMVTIEYDHFPPQMVLRDAESKVARINLKRAGSKVAYIMGLGDEIPASLEQIGYEVDLLNLDNGDMTLDNLQKYDAVILGVRVYNGIDRIKFHQPTLLEYVANGGTLIVQYNKNYNLSVPMDELAPYPLKISRDRVSVEEAEVRFLAPQHELLNFPNEITEKDFEGWIQERGLYFPDEWADQFTAILSSNDPGEPPRNGGLLVAPYGKGHYIYTGYSWFRQLPAGVPGAYRIFANMISIGKAQP